MMLASSTVMRTKIREMQIPLLVTPIVSLVRPMRALVAGNEISMTRFVLVVVALASLVMTSESQVILAGVTLALERAASPRGPSLAISLKQAQRV